MGSASDFTHNAARKLSVSDRALINDDFRMIFSLEGNILPHISDLFEVFDVSPQHADLFMDYYGSQILRLDKFGTVESEFGRNLNFATLAKISPMKFGDNILSIIEPFEILLSDVKRFKRRLLLMKEAPEIEDCFSSKNPAFEAESYMFTRERFSVETANEISDEFIARAAHFRGLDA